MKTTVILALSALFFATAAPGPTANPEFEHPLIEQHGGIVVLPQAGHQPKKDSKVVLDITSDAKSGSVIKGFDRAALILNTYTHANAGMENGFQMSIILHGAATKAALNDDAYAKQTKPYARAKGKTKNPNLALIRRLDEAGVKIFVCGQALAHQGFTAEEVASGVEVVVSAATVNINLQMDDYAYLPFH